ncbi:MAG: S9 family peptidase, partial [Actinobacteria bacterium]|nr:S9 family peptidase [Actinomycetota bacterium]
MSELPFPRHSARTLRFSLGAPRNFTISPDGQRVVFVRSGSGTDRTGRLFELDLNSKNTREIVNPLDLLKSGDEKISVEEQARRERAREAAAGITNYSSDTNLKKIAFTLSGNLYVANLEDGKVLQWPAQEPVIDPQFAPDGSAVGYINPSGEMRVSDGVNDRAIFSPEKADVYYGQAEFVASEEMDRMHGFWWSSDSKYLLVERFDESGVEKIWISDPANPENEPREVRYPKVGSANVLASLFAYHLESKSSQEIKWDKEHEYLVSVNSGAANKPPLLMTIDRAQRHAHIRAINLGDGTSTVIAEMRDPAWITLVSGSPQWGPAGQLITTFDSATTRHLAVDGNPVTPDGLQVDRIVHVDRNGITFEGTFEATS